MKSQILNLAMICLALTLGLMSCDKSTNLLEEGASQLSTPTIDDFDFDPSEVVEYPSTLIATIQKDGHEIQFSTTGPPESQGILMAEHLYGKALENEEFITGVNEESTPFDIFLAMTDEEVEVPKSIAASAKENQLDLSGRRVQETAKILNLLDENYTEPVLAEVEERACNVPSLSCYPSASWNLGSCDRYARTNTVYKRHSYKNGWKKVRKIYAKVSHNCGPLSMYFYSWNRAGANSDWAFLHSVRTPNNYGSNKTYTHWVPNLVERMVIYVGGGSSIKTNYRTTTQFVK